MLLSVVMTTYNWPQALNVVLTALKAQTDLRFEVVIGDDGSTDETKRMIESFRQGSPFPIKHIWQEDLGFRAAAARNKAILAASGDYIVFLDHDSVPIKHFIENHYRYAEPGYFVSGSRILVAERLTNTVISGLVSLSALPFWRCFAYYCQGQLNRFWRLVPLKLGPLRYLKKNKWQGTKNYIGVWKKDLLTVGGYDESYEGWGYEDSDLVVRLLQQGIKRKSTNHATEVFHLHHVENSRSNANNNQQRLDDRIAGKYTTCFGIEQYIANMSEIL